MAGAFSAFHTTDTTWANGACTKTSRRAVTERARTVELDRAVAETLADSVSVEDQVLDRIERQHAAALVADTVRRLPGPLQPDGLDPHAPAAQRRRALAILRHPSHRAIFAGYPAGQRRRYRIRWIAATRILERHELLPVPSRPVHPEDEWLARAACKGLCYLYFFHKSAYCPRSPPRRSAPAAPSPPNASPTSSTTWTEAASGPGPPNGNGGPQTGEVKEPRR